MIEENDGYFAHSLEGRPASDWQTLETHLFNTAELAGQMAKEIGCYGWGYLAGLWHDLGKFSPTFQRYIRTTGASEAGIEGSKLGRGDHSTAGAIWAIEHLGIIGRILAYQIAGHHAGLADFESDTTGNAALSQRIKQRNLLEAILPVKSQADILNQALPTERPKAGADLSLWVRLLFSCLVDADYLDTENFMEPARSAPRGRYPQLSELLPLFTDYMSIKTAKAPLTKVNQIRANVLAQCIAKAKEPPGIYSLTVPTGGWQDPLFNGLCFTPCGQTR